MQKEFLTPAEITEKFVAVGQKKASLSVVDQIILGILAGAFIAFASEGSNMAIHTIESVGLGKALAGALFSTGLMLVMVAGGELFTGNCLMIVALSERKIAFLSMLRNWLFVYAGNFIGSLITAYFINRSGQLGFSNGMLGGYTINVAIYKTSLTFENAFFMGIMCNWLVCLAVWMATATNDVAGRLLAIFFPIWLFITSGFEHCVANMYYISAGILAKSNSLCVGQAINMGGSPMALANLSWRSLFVDNLLPVTLGNIVGGAFFVGFIYWFTYRRNIRASQGHIE